MEVLGLCRHEPDQLEKVRGKMVGKYSRFYFCYKEETLTIRVYHDHYLRRYTEYSGNQFDELYIIVKQPFLSYRDYFLQAYQQKVQSEDRYNPEGKKYHFQLRKGTIKEDIKLVNLPRQQAVKMLEMDYKGYKIFERFLEKWIPIE